MAQFLKARDENRLKERMTLLVKPKLLILDRMVAHSLETPEFHSYGWVEDPCM